MPVGQDLDGEKRSRELPDPDNLQNSPGPRGGKPENIDILVARFLDELSDIKSELSQSEEPGANSQNAAVATGQPGGTRFRSPTLSSESDSELENINREIESSLIELESLKAEPTSPEPIRVPEVQKKPSSTEVPKPKARIAPTKRPAPVVSGEVVWDGLELFRTSMAAQRNRRNLRFGLILGGMVLLTVLGAAAFYFHLL
jgi:hypothetical protein